MEDIDKKNEMSGRRRFLITATSIAGGIASIAWATPFIMSMFPSERAKEAGHRLRSTSASLNQACYCWWNIVVR